MTAPAPGTAPGTVDPQAPAQKPAVGHDVVVTPAQEIPAVTTARARMTGKQRREQLLEVGRKLFADMGFEATTVEEIEKTRATRGLR